MGEDRVYDIASLIQRLELDRGAGAPDLSWIRESTTRPGPFWSALMDHVVTSSAVPPRSRPGERFDLYYDMVARHASRAGVALQWYERARGFQTLSYAELHARVTRKAAAWAAQKVEPGDVVAIVLPVGPEWLVALLTAVRMGACACFLPPMGERFLAKRLASLASKHIATEPAWRPVLAGFEELVLRDVAGGAPYPEQWHSFAPGEAVGSVFSPLHEPPEQPRKVAADVAYLSALRDGVLAHRLAPGAALAAPGFHPLQHQPAMVFATLLAGACYVHLPAEDVEADPRLMSRLALASAGITVPIREALLRAGERTGAWDHWFKSPEEPFDVDAWDQLVKALRLEKTPTSNLLVDPTLGGAALFSLRRRGNPDLRVLPAPGVPYALYDINGGGDEAPGAFGLFARKPSDAPAKDGHALLVQMGAEYLYGGCLRARRDGRVYPAAEVNDAIAELPFVAGSFVLPVVSGGVASRPLFTLVVFTGAERADARPEGESAWSETITRVIVARVGRDALPDRTRFFPLYPRQRGGKLDEAWCESQYRTGLLARKARHPVFIALTALRARGGRDAPRA